MLSSNSSFDSSPMATASEFSTSKYKPGSKKVSVSVENNLENSAASVQVSHKQVSESETMGNRK